eukprot:TRINITY_DN15075_c0_g1_i1.p1 TRINITY_DN15075_c0_g1~~TRINITY_DN15075_c0_g1_i1.p1  ORF type:complete len:340 (+),score=60.68 TRINITY_DN15075_c0_g1_i1:132-1022(+)
MEVPPLIKTHKRVHKPRLERPRITWDVLLCENGVARVDEFRHHHAFVRKPVNNYEDPISYQKVHQRYIAESLRLLLERYQRWATFVQPGLAYADFVEKTEDLSNCRQVRKFLENLRRTRSIQDALEAASAPALDVLPTDAEAAAAQGDEPGMDALMDDDDLDRLVAQNEQVTTSRSWDRDDNDEDEDDYLHALREMEEGNNVSPSPMPPISQRTNAHPVQTAAQLLPTSSVPLSQSSAALNASSNVRGRLQKLVQDKQISQTRREVIKHQQVEPTVEEESSPPQRRRLRRMLADDD